MKVRASVNLLRKVQNHQEKWKSMVIVKIQSTSRHKDNRKIFFRKPANFSRCCASKLER